MTMTPTQIHEHVDNRPTIMITGGHVTAGAWQEKLSVDLTEYVAALAKLHPFVKDVVVDYRRVVPELAQFWPTMPGQEEQARELWKYINEIVHSFPVREATSNYLLRITVLASPLAPLMIPETHESLSIATFDGVTGNLHRGFIPETDKLPNLNYMSIPTGIMILCQPLPPLINPFRSMISSAYRALTNLFLGYTGRNRDRILSGYDAFDPSYPKSPSIAEQIEVERKTAKGAVITAEMEKTRLEKALKLGAEAIVAEEIARHHGPEAAYKITKQHELPESRREPTVEGRVTTDTRYPAPERHETPLESKREPMVDRRVAAAEARYEAPERRELPEARREPTVVRHVSAAEAKYEAPERRELPEARREPSVERRVVAETRYEAPERHEAERGAREFVHAADKSPDMGHETVESLKAIPEAMAQHEKVEPPIIPLKPHDDIVDLTQYEARHGYVHDIHGLYKYGVPSNMPNVPETLHEEAAHPTSEPAVIPTTKIARNTPEALEGMPNGAATTISHLMDLTPQPELLATNDVPHEEQEGMETREHVEEPSIKPHPIPPTLSEQLVKQILAAEQKEFPRPQLTPKNPLIHNLNYAPHPMDEELG